MTKRNACQEIPMQICASSPLHCEIEQSFAVRSAPFQPETMSHKPQTTAIHAMAQTIALRDQPVEHAGFDPCRLRMAFIPNFAPAGAFRLCGCCNPVRLFTSAPRMEALAVDLALKLNVIAVCAVFVFVGAIVLGAF